MVKLNRTMILALVVVALLALAAVALRVAAASLAVAVVAATLAAGLAWWGLKGRRIGHRRTDRLEGPGDRRS